MTETVHRGWPSWALPGCVFLLVSAGFLLGWAATERAEDELVRAETELNSEQIAIRIEEYLRVRLNVVLQVRDHWQQNDTGGIDVFVANAALERQRYPEIDAINWVDTDGIIRRVVPHEPNVAALGRDLTRHPVAAGVLAAARVSGRPAISPPLELYQGGRGFTIYVPFFRHGTLEGFINAAFRVTPLIEDCLSRGVREHYHFSLRDGTMPVYGYEGDSEEGLRFAASREISVADRVWSLRAYPTPAKLARSELRTDEIILLLGLLSATLLAYSTRRTLVSRRLVSESRERLRRVVQDVPAMICRYRPDLTLTFVNQAFADRVGNDPAALIGTSLLATMGNDQRRQFVDRIAALSPERPLMIYEHCIQTDDGARWEEWRDRALVDDSGCVSEFQSIVLDVSESHVAREDLRDSEERFRAIFSSVSDAILILDETGRILDANEPAREFRATADEPLEPSSIFDLGADPEVLRGAIGEIWHTDGGDSRLVQWRAVAADGREFWAEASLKATELGGRRRLLAVVRNVTRRKKLEAQLRHAQKMEAVGTLAGGVAHDFNNILTAILGHTELARARTTDDSPARASLDGIAEACDRAAGVTRSLLTFCREKSVEKGFTELRDLAAETLRMLRPILPAAIEVATELPEGPTWVGVDRTQMQQILMNLALNARDAMGDGGVLRVSITSTAGSAATAGFAAILVSDTGVGMTEYVRERAIEPFFTTKPRERGTGLGMAVVHGIVTEHGGRMEIESQPGRGTTVQIRLPLAAPDPSVEASPEATTDRVRPGQRVLLVEDDDQVRELAATALRRRGYEVLEAGDGAAATAIAGDPDARLDLLVLDIDLPKLSGKAVLAQARTAGCESPVLLISGNPAHGLGDPLPEAVTFLEKPFTMSELATAVEDLIRSHGSAGSPALRSSAGPHGLEFDDGQFRPAEEPQPRSVPSLHADPA